MIKSQPKKIFIPYAHHKPSETNPTPTATTQNQTPTNSKKDSKNQPANPPEPAATYQSPSNEHKPYQSHNATHHQTNP